MPAAISAAPAVRRCGFFSVARSTTSAYGDSSTASENGSGPGARCTIMTSISLAALTTLRSEEHTSELQSRGHLVCRLLLEKKNTAGVHVQLRNGKSEV